ncbi:MAG: TrkA family potassium uptake protein [Gammaproteobacteria bacterium]|nr:TrkA family potassium uptake protein [Gammaproteobacteria bacterium]
MRTVFIGAGPVTTMTAQQLLANDYEVVIIEKDKALIDELSADLGAGFIHGDGSKPAILREADPAATDFLFSLTGNDQNNILASLVGRSLGFKRVVTRIEDPAYEHICIELGLEDIIIPDYTIARYLADMCAGQNPLQLSAVIKGKARVFSFVAREQDEGTVKDLKLPDDCRVMFLYRNDNFIFADEDTSLLKNDEVVIISRLKALPELEARWNLKGKGNQQA